MSMTTQDIVLLLDKKYSGKGALPCPNEGIQVKMQGSSTSIHGALSVHSSGANLVCGVCGYKEAVGRP